MRLCARASLWSAGLSLWATFRVLFFYRKHVLWIVFILAFGLFGLLMLEGIGESFQKTLAGRAKVILGSDLALSSKRPLDDGEKQFLQEFARTHDLEMVRVYDLFSVILSGKKSQLVQVRASGVTYPFYGKMEFQHQKSVTTKENSEIRIDEGLVPLLDIKQGQQVELGVRPLTISNIVTQDPGMSWRSFDLAPRVYLSIEALKKTGLISPNSLVSREWHFASTQEIPWANLKKILKEKFFDPQIQIKLANESSQNIGRVFRYLKDFLALIGLIGLGLSMLGVNYLLEGLWKLQSRSFALLKLCGATTRQLSLDLINQIIWPLLAAYFLASLLFLAATPILSLVLNQYVPIDLSYSAVFRWDLFVILAAMFLIFLLPSLFEMRKLSPKALLSTEIDSNQQSQQSDKSRWWFSLIRLLFFTGAAIWYSRSLTLGFFFSAAISLTFALALGVQTAGHKFLESLIRHKKIHLRSLSFYLGVKDFLGKKRSHFVLFLGLALVQLLLTLVGQVPQGLEWEWGLSENKSWKTPDFFVFNIQPDQVKKLQRWIKQSPIESESLSPMVRGRFLSVNGVALDKWETATKGSREKEEQGRLKDRGINLSYRQKLESWEEILEGRPFDLQRKGPPGISVEFRYAKRLGLSVGDRLGLEVEGELITGKIQNIRKVDWLSFRPNFFLQMQPGVLEEFSKTFLVSLFLPPGGEIMTWQTQLIQEFPNLSVVDVRKIIGKITSLVSSMLLAVYVMSALAGLAGLFVFFAIIRHQALSEQSANALYQTIGVTTAQLKWKLFWFYSLFLFMALGMGTALGLLATCLIGKVLFYSYWPIHGVHALIGFGSLWGFGLVSALAFSWRPLSSKPRDFLY